jgi:hypothetical protein
MLPQRLEGKPSEELIQEALSLWMEYRPIYQNGKLLYYKLYHKKNKKPCGCGGGI